MLRLISSPPKLLLFIHISGPSEGYDFEVLAEPVKSLLHGDIARSPVG